MRKLKSATLVRKGYLPLPVEKGQKGCFLEGWPDAHWEGEAPGLGLNLVGLVMIDFDLDLVIPEDTERDFVMELCSMVSPTAPIRVRNDSTRAAMLLQCPELDDQKFYQRTSKWAEGHIEVKGGRGKFMFGWGKHPAGAILHWDVGGADTQNPSDFPVRSALPILTRDELFELVPMFEAKLKTELGEPRQSGAGSGLSRGGWEQVFDITDDMTFTTNDGEEFTPFQLRDEVNRGSDSRRMFVNLTPWRPNSDSMAGLVSWSSAYDCIRVTDLVEGVVHYSADLYQNEDIDLTDIAGDLPIFQVPDAVRNARVDREMTDAERSERANAMLFVETQNAYVWRHDPEAIPMVKGALFSNEKAADKAEMLRQIPFVNRQIWDPALPPMSVVENQDLGWYEHNVFYRPQRPTKGGELDTFQRWFEKFIPDDEERQHVLYWLAAKAQHPHERLFAIALVGPQGSGKSSLWRLIQALWHPINVAMPGTMEEAYRGTYQDALFRRLYTLFDEVSSEEAGTDYDARRKSANALKSFVDTGSSVKRLNIKYGRQQDVKVVSTIGVATNYQDSLPLDADDRRFLIVSTAKKLDWNRLPKWQTNPNNLGLLMDYLTTFDLGTFDFRNPPMTTGKERMLEISQTDTEEAITELLGYVKESGGFILQKQVDWYFEVRGIHTKQKSAARRIYKRTFPNSKPYKKAPIGMFRARSPGDVNPEVGSEVVLAAVNQLSDKLTQAFPHGGGAPKLEKRGV